jgi:TusA-related sulfurtransferase
MNPAQGGCAPQQVGVNRYLLNVKRQTCPYPHLLTCRAIDALSPGDTLEVHLDNPPSVRDIPPALRSRGYDVDDPKETGDGTWIITVTV